MNPFAIALLKRLGWAAVTLWGVSVVVFALLFIVPRFGRSRLNEKAGAGTDPTTMMALAFAGAHASDENVAAIKRERGLDRPLIVQYGMFVRDAATNNLKSYRNGAPVMSSIARRFPATLLLALSGLAIWLAVSIPLGTLTAQRDRSFTDRAVMVLCVLAVSIPTFWLGKLLQYYAGYRWGLASVGGEASLWNLPLPALTLGLGGAAYYSRLLHANLRGVLKQDFIRSARTRGLGEKQVLGKHGLKNALIPLVTILGMDFASLLSGLIFTEKIFGWPGIGSLAVDSIMNQDTPMIMGTVLFSGLVVVIANIVVDVAYRLIDPRVRLA
jgi:peptide/nickel transport system permease protein